MARDADPACASETVIGEDGRRAVPVALSTVRHFATRKAESLAAPWRPQIASRLPSRRSLPNQPASPSSQPPKLPSKLPPKPTPKLPLKLPSRMTAQATAQVSSQV